MLLQPANPMCGLAGIIEADTQNAAELNDAVARMTATLAHRGPDDVGIWTDPHAGVGLGFRRLAIIDLSANGHQPMRSSSGRFVMAFNGEVYNYVELRSALAQQGATFRGHSDTEVMLAAFERWGVKGAVSRFVGMFAIALWDETCRTLYLIRDRLGIKPLYVHWQPGRVIFGSELKALHAHPEFQGEVDVAALSAYLRYLYVPTPHCILKDCWKLPPGHILTISDTRTAPPVSEPFWSLPDVAVTGRKRLFAGDETRAADELDGLLRDAVALRMRADVPVGAFLSGGIDSSLVTALMQQCTSQPVRTFTIGFAEEQWNEAAYAARIAEHIGTRHTSVTLTANDSLALVPELAQTFDEPLADPSQLPTMLVSQIARRDVTVALCGDGGDEVFAGYNRYMHGKWAVRSARATPQWLRTSVAQAIERRAPAHWDRRFQKVRFAGDKLHKLAALLRAQGSGGMYRSLLSQWQNPTSFVGGSELEDAVDRAFALNGQLSLLDKMMLADQVAYLCDDLIAKVDRASMGVALEVRVPILDHRVVEFSWRLPDHLRVRGSETKRVLRHVLHRYVPRELVERPKMGFSVPIDGWLRGPLRDWADDLLAPSALQQGGLFDAEKVSHAYSAFRAGHTRNAMGVWAILLFQAWQQKWAAPQKDSPRFAVVA